MESTSQRSLYDAMRARQLFPTACCSTHRRARLFIALLEKPNSQALPAYVAVVAHTTHHAQQKLALEYGSYLRIQVLREVVTVSVVPDQTYHQAVTRSVFQADGQSYRRLEFFSPRHSQQREVCRCGASFDSHYNGHCPAPEA